jgi:hypothetical protein
LRRYLQDQGVDLKRPITIQMPVNLRREGEKTAGNKIGIIQVELSPPTDDPYVRLRNIGYSLRNVRTMIDSVAPEAIESYTVITGLVAQLAELLKLSNPAAHGQHAGLQRAGPEGAPVRQGCPHGRDAPHQHAAAQQPAQHHAVQLRRPAVLRPDRDRRTAQAGTSAQRI